MVHGCPHIAYAQEHEVRNIIFYVYIIQCELLTKSHTEHHSVIAAVTVRKKYVERDEGRNGEREREEKMGRGE